MLPLILLIIACAPFVAANAEKVIFLGPTAVPIPVTKPTLSDLNLRILSPEASSVRTSLSRVFPNKDIVGQEKGQSTWLLLDNLTEGQRYELRVCWAAIEPTEFDLKVYELDQVFGTPDLIASLAKYAYSHMPEPDLEAESVKEQSAAQERTASVLLLHVQAAADYFSHDLSLMNDPPPVLVDLILDPYLYNVLPRSLLPTSMYIVLVAVATWYVARWVTFSLSNIANEPAPLEARKMK